jgi:hypothetical protein
MPVIEHCYRGFDLAGIAGRSEINSIRTLHAAAEPQHYA